MADKMFLTREEILAKTDLPYEDAEVPEWGGWVRIRALSGKQRDAIEASIVEMNGTKRTVNLQNYRAKIVSASLVDVDGNRLFTEKDVVALGNTSAASLNKAFTIARLISGITDTDVEESVKNSESDQSDSSTSD